MNPKSAETVTETLADYFSAFAKADISEKVITEARRLVVDYFGVALAGSRTDSGKLASEYVFSQGGIGDATIIGSDKRVPAASAAFANAISEHSIELDDVDVEALFHHGPPVVSAALAVGQKIGATGAQVLKAIVAGCEMMNRLSRASNNSLRNRGFHTTPTCGVFGAAAAAGVLLGLTRDQFVSALGLAGAQASGLMEMYGTSMQKRFNPGPAARNGVVAAEMALAGFTGAETIIDGPRGFGKAFVDEFNSAELVETLGQDIPVAIEFKPYSAARPIHNAIDCALIIRNEHGVSAEDIESIEVARHPEWAEYHVIDNPGTYHEAQVSLPYSVAVAFTDGAALFDQYSNDRIENDDHLMALTKKVKVTIDSSLLRGVSCHMKVKTKDGMFYESVVDYAKGSLQNPLSMDELFQKFELLASVALDDMRIKKLRNLLEGIDSVSDINQLLEATH